MRQSKRIAVLFGVITLTLIGIGNPSMAQDAGPTTRPGGPGGGRRNFDPAQFQKMITDRLKEAMAVSDEDWAAIEPRIEKVMTVQRDAGGGGMGFGRLLGFGGPGGFGGQAEEDESKLSPIALAAKKLQTAIDANSGPDELAAKMAAYRDAQAKARQQLADARASLKEVLTHKQEAVLLMVGILD
jgi:hypothetical protein